MGLKDEIISRIGEVVDQTYTATDANVVPNRDSVTFGPTSKKLFARVLYIDVRGSRSLLSEHDQTTVLKAHKAFIYAVTKCVRAEGGEPRNFSGDSILAFWAGKGGTTAKAAVRAAMKSRFAIDSLLNPRLREKYGVALDYGMGVAQGEVLVGKSGVAGDANFQDLIWIGWSVYHAVSYGDRASKPKAIWISRNIHSSIKNESSLTTGSDGKNIWVWKEETFPIGTVRVYKTSYHQKFS